MKTLPFLLETKADGALVEVPPEAELALVLAQAEMGRRKGGKMDWGREGETLLWVARLLWPWHLVPDSSGEHRLLVDSLGLFAAGFPTPTPLSDEAAAAWQEESLKTKKGVFQFCGKAQAVTDIAHGPMGKEERAEGVVTRSTTVGELVALLSVPSERPEAWNGVSLPTVLGRADAAAMRARLDLTYRRIDDEGQALRALLAEEKGEATGLLAALRERRSALEEKLKEHATDGQIQSSSRLFALRKERQEAVEAIGARFGPVLAKLKEESTHWQSEVERLSKEPEQQKALAQAQKASAQCRQKQQEVRSQRNQAVQEVVTKANKEEADEDASFSSSGKTIKEDLRRVDAQIRRVQTASQACEKALVESTDSIGALRKQLASVELSADDLPEGQDTPDLIAVPVWVACYRTPKRMRHKFFLPATLPRGKWRDHAMQRVLSRPGFSCRASLPSLKGGTSPSKFDEGKGLGWKESLEERGREGDFLRRPSFDIELESGLTYWQEQGRLTERQSQWLRGATEAYALTAQQLRTMELTPAGQQTAVTDLKGLVKQQQERYSTLETRQVETQRAYLYLLRQLHQEVGQRKSPGVQLPPSPVETLAVETAKRLGMDHDRLGEIALLCDVGLLFLPEVLVQRELPLSFEDRRKLEGHVPTGHQLLKAMGYGDDLMNMVMTHHENYDGSGYPKGLAGEEIPLGGRVLRAVDYYYDLTTPTFDRRGLDAEAAVQALGQASGTLLDPKVVNVLSRLVAESKPVETGMSQAIYTVSHELRSPLSFLLGYAELLNDRNDLPSDIKTQVSEIHGEAVHMTQLVQKILDVSRFETGNVHLAHQSVDLGLLVRDAVEKRKVIAKRRVFDWQAPPQAIPVTGDRDRLSEVVDNLLENAVRYSPDTSPIIVQVRQMDSGVLVRVQDRGIGIPKGDQLKVFGKFFRADNAKAKDAEGSGLGLNLCKQIVEAHGGKIWFESEEGKGTTFYFLLPVAVAAAA